MRRNRRGFTLIELLIVIVIIGILAVVAASVIVGAKAKGICTEAATGIATLRTAFANYYSEYRAFPNIQSLQWLTNPGGASPIDANTLRALGLTGETLNSFNGRYFSNNCYLITSGPPPGQVGAPFLRIYAFPNPSQYDAGTANTSQGGLSGETQSIVDLPRTGMGNYGLIYVSDTNTVRSRIMVFRISRVTF